MTDPGLTRPPSNIRHLQALVTAFADANDMTAGRVQRWISFMIVAGALDRLRTGDDTPVFVMKGGLTLELRLGLSARATRDLDAIARVERTLLTEQLAHAFDTPYAGFTFRLDGMPATVGPALQYHVRLRYLDKPWGTVQLELTEPESMPVEYEPVKAIDLAAFRLAGPDVLPCLSIRYQVAQKLHAVTAPHPLSDRPNPRFRDVADLVLLAPLLDDWGAVHRACVDVFTSRAQQLWPPALKVHPEWVEPYAALAVTLDVETDLAAAVNIVNTLIQHIDLQR